MNTSKQPCWNNLVAMIIIQKHPPLDSTVTSLYSGHCRDFELVSSLARAHSSESVFQSNVCNIFCRGFSSCPYYWGVCYSRVSTRRELTVLANGTPTLITVSSPPYTVSLSVSWSVSQSGSQSASQWLFQLCPPVSCLKSVRHLLRCSISQSFCQLFHQSFPQPVSQSVKQSVSNSVTQSVSKLDS